MRQELRAVMCAELRRSTRDRRAVVELVGEWQSLTRVVGDVLNVRKFTNFALPFMKLPVKGQQLEITASMIPPYVKYQSFGRCNCSFTIKASSAAGSGAP